MSNLLIRNVKPEDLDQLFEIEGKTFPAAEMATKGTIMERIIAFPNCFFVAEKDEEIVGFMNGCPTNSHAITDELFHNITRESNEGENVVVFSLNVSPQFQNQGIAAQLINHFIENAKIESRKKVILTCKQHLIHYYEKFGFVNGGLSGSTHGGAQWFHMTLSI